ncbi:hypothetical protein GQ43DRAFT_351697, partial [Delitschia confertaspora ATCC 74209]
TEKLPDPPMFSGRRKDLPAFKRKLLYKLEGNADRYASERARLIYAHSRLERDPVTLVDPLMEDQINTQGKKAFISHFAEFRRLVADTDLNESA